MNKNIRTVLVKRIYKHQIWYEVISVEQYYGTPQTSEAFSSAFDVAGRNTPESNSGYTRRRPGFRLQHPE